jgi:CHAD domain-containing protein
VVTLRVQAEVELKLGEILKTNREGEAILHFSRQAKKLRKALGPVREFDVWIGKLRRLRESMGDGSKYVPRSTNECARQIERLENRLKEKHRKARRKLVAEIEKRQGHFLAATDGIDAAMLKDASHSESVAAERILGRFAAVASGFAKLDAENLHEFRKRIKTVRYLAEISADIDSACKRIARKMQEIQSAIGEWHDWQSLAKEVSCGRGKRSELSEMLESLASESLEAALSTCHRIRARLVEQPAWAQSEASSLGRKPPPFSDCSGFPSSHRKVA